MWTRSPFWTHQSPPLACSYPLWKGSRSASLWHRSHPRQCDTSCQSAPALQTRLLTTVRWKTPSLQRRGPHPCSEQGRTCPALRGDGFADKRRRRNGTSGPERVRLLQPLLPRPQRGWRPTAHPISQNPEPRPHETAVQDDYVETDPLANMPRGLVLFPGSERCLLSHPVILVHGPALWNVPGSPHFYKVHGRGPFPSKTDGNPHSQLPRRLAHSRSVRGGIVVAEIRSFSATWSAWDSGSTLPRAHCLPANGYRSWEQFSTRPK